MIYDRTIDDVNNAINIRNRGMPFSESDIEALERGMVTINTLNRIEQKQSELKDILNDMGYFNISIENKQWSCKDVFDESNFDRIVENNVLLRKAFFTSSNAPKDAIAIYHYKEFNALEQILYDLQQMAEYVKSKYRLCGTFNCGG